MRNLIAILTLILASGIAYGQSDTRNLQPFENLSVSGSLDVTVYEGSPRAEITMIHGDLDELEVIQKGKSLKLKFKNRINWSSKRQAKIDLYVQNLSSIDVAAGAEVYSEFVLTATKFYADASSGAELSIAVEATKIDADASSGAQIIIEGSANTLNIDASSGASYNGVRLKAKDVDADVSSGASISVWATERIEADASSGGSIRYKGNPTEESIDPGKWSGGSISKI